MTTQVPGDATLAVLRTAAGDEACVSLHGGHLLSWRPAGQDEQIYLSPLSRPAPGKAVRGGTPVCFPQFADRGPLTKHGFARTARWEVLAAPVQQGDRAEARFQLDSTSAAMPWEHAFRLELTVRLAPATLELELQASNTGASAFAFTAALHTYFALPDVRTAKLRGLQGLSYEDSLQANTVRTESLEALTFDGEIDRVYRAIPAPMLLQASGMPQRRVSQQGFTDAVVWNPGPDKAVRLGDMPGEDWPRMLCIEAAVIDRPVQLAPGQSWRGTQRIEVLPLSR